MPSLLFNVQVTEAGTNLKFDKRDFLNYRHHVSRLSPSSSTSGSDYPTLLPYCKSHRNGWGTTYELDGSLVSEESVSSKQSYGTAGFCGYRSFPRQNPIGTRRLDATYPGHNPMSLRQVGRERERSKANVVIVAVAESNHVNSVSVETSNTFLDAENMDLGWMHTADLFSDEDEYLPRRPATPRFAIAPPQEVTLLPRLYAHNSRIRASANNALRRMRMQDVKPKQNCHPSRRHPFPIGGSNPFQPTWESLRPGEEPLAHIMPSLERLGEDDEEILAHIQSRLSLEESMLQELRRRKRSPAGLSSQTHDHYLAEHRHLSPPEIHRDLDEESIDRPESEVGQFHDFPVCEMSIAMGLHS